MDINMWSKSLPMINRVGDMTLRSQKFNPEKDFDEVFQILKSSMTDSDGVGEDEFDTPEKFEKMLSNSWASTTLHHEEANDRIASFGVYYPTPLSRSREPLCAGGYGFVHKDYRGKGILTKLFFMQDVMMCDAGFPGVLGRMALTARSAVPNVLMGSHLTGAIPKSIKVARFGWMTDLMGWRDNKPLMNQHQIKVFNDRKRRLEVQRVRRLKGVSTLQPSDHVVKPETFVTHNNQRFILRGAKISELDTVEEMILDCARSGDGFNLDEFSPEDGHFLHKFIHEPKVLVALDDNNEISGLVVFGLSKLVRNVGAVVCAYCVVAKSYRRQGLASKLLNMATMLSKEQKCDTLAIDVFLNNHAGIQLLKKHGFLITGSIPYNGFLVDCGFTDSLLMCKRLDDVTTLYPLAKM